MTCKDYITLARAINAAANHAATHAETPAHAAGAAGAVADMVHFMADALAYDNARFDRERFITACREGC